MSKGEVSPEYLAVMSCAVQSFSSNTRPGFIEGTRLLAGLTDDQELTEQYEHISYLGLQTNEYIDHLALRYGARVALCGSLELSTPKPLAHYLEQFKQRRQTFTRWPMNQFPDRSLFGIVPKRLTKDLMDTEIDKAIRSGDFAQARRIYEIGKSAGALLTSTRVLVTAEMTARIGVQWLTAERKAMELVGVDDIPDSLAAEHTLEVLLADQQGLGNDMNPEPVIQ